MTLQLAGDRLNFGRGDGPPVYFSIFQLQNELLNRSGDVIQTLAGSFMRCLGHPSMIPC